jgi:hypothetical protein
MLYNLLAGFFSQRMMRFYGRKVAVVKGRESVKADRKCKALYLLSGMSQMRSITLLAPVEESVPLGMK